MNGSALGIEWFGSLSSVRGHGTTKGRGTSFGLKLECLDSGADVCFGRTGVVVLESLAFGEHQLHLYLLFIYLNLQQNLNN